MRRYPVLVKVVHNDVSIIEDDFGPYGQLVENHEYIDTQFHLVTCDEELSDIEESCATSEGADTMSILGYIGHHEIVELAKFLLRVESKEKSYDILACPNCGSCKVDGSPLKIKIDKVNELLERMKCSSCGAEWINCYQLYHQQTE